MNREEVVERFRRTGALLEGHFVLTSGLHSSQYLQCALVLQHPSEAEAFGRGFSVRPGERVLVVEDVITTGGSTRETCDALRAAGALVVGAASIIDRSGGRADVGVPRIALATLEVPAVAPADCPLCARGVPAVKPGSRKQ